jgi:hypothetical protein
MQPSEYYSEIGGSNIANEVWSLVNDGTEWKAHNSFLAKQIPEHIYLQEPLLKYLSIKHSLLVGILMMHPFHVYNWHTDGNRRCGINLLLSDSPSHCLFTDDETITNSKVIELSYMPTTYYAFNTDKKHMVVNLNRPRYLMSVEIDGGKNTISYDELLKELDEYANA